MIKNHFKIIVPLYNSEQWIHKTIKSLELQEYNNFECIIIDDCSTDNSYEIAKKSITGKKKYKLYRNENNLGPLANAYRGAMELCSNLEDENIVAILDGDDFLFSPKSLSILNEKYQDQNCWMTYGSYVNLSDKKKGKFSRQVPDHVIKSNGYRSYEWCTSHMRTYKSFLLKNVNIDDLLDEKGNFYRAAGDLALMFPLLEMSGENAKYIKDILYIWNDLSPLNEHKNKRDVQLFCESQIRNGKRYSKLNYTRGNKIESKS
jgi:glycosyltransferase involved in cell wall biosynthesis